MNVYVKDHQEFSTYSKHNLLLQKEAESIKLASSANGFIVGTNNNLFAIFHFFKKDKIEYENFIFNNEGFLLDLKNSELMVDFYYNPPTKKYLIQTLNSERE